MGYTIGSGNLIYRGAFAVPEGANGSPSHFHGFAFGGQAIGFNPYRGPSGSLFIVGHPDESRIAEISIPAVKTGSIGSLNSATTLQNLTNVTSRVTNYTLEDTVYIGGMLVTENSGMVVTLYEYYDGDADATDSHYTLNTLNLASGAVSGLFTVGTLNPGYLAGYMSYIPAAHTGTIGKKHLTGMCAVAVAARTSNGPGLFAFDASDLVDISTTKSVEDLVYYPMPQGGSGPNDHPIQPVDSTNPIYNTSSQIRGVVWASGADNVLFFGSHGTGTWWYGSNGDIPGLNDPVRTSKGEHAYPYRYQIWSYPVSGLMQVMSGIINPWEAPYTYWELTLPYDGGSYFAGGVAFDQQRNRIYLSQLNVLNAGLDTLPVIHAFDISGSSEQSSGGTAHTVSTTDITRLRTTINNINVSHQTQYCSTNQTVLSIDVNVTSPPPVFIIESGISTYLRSGLLEHVFRGATLSKPTVWLGLASSLPTKSGGFSELSAAGNYTRIAITGNSLWSNPSGGIMTNNTDIVFGAASSNWVPVSGWGIFDQSGIGAGNLLFYSAASGKTVTIGDNYRFASGTLTVNLG